MLAGAFFTLFGGTYDIKEEEFLVNLVLNIEKDRDRTLKSQNCQHMFITTLSRGSAINISLQKKIKVYQNNEDSTNRCDNTSL